MLGIDPGSRITGYAALVHRGRQFSVVESGVIVVHAEENLSERLALLSVRMDEILERVRPEAVAVEDVFFAKNVRSALLLGHARGVVLAAAGRRGLPVHAYPPATVKQAVAGHGRADKGQVQRMVQVLLSLAELPRTDEADAIAVAICHGLCHRQRSMVAAGR
ncbi:MAG: crossover junction endodeoxyribonuclease RuvC [Deltaproteobacteria bacterium]|nr:crossover junction endodeoxyribonuclease RuvC [Deltaproteobacteria bacterium]